MAELEWVRDEDGVGEWRATNGGSNPLTVLGPFTVTHDTPGASTVLWNAKAGDVILMLWAIPTVTWTDGSQLEIYTGSMDILNPRKANGDLIVSQDATRYALSTNLLSSTWGVAGGGQDATPTLMKADTDVTCDIIGSPAAGSAEVYALVYSPT